MANKKQYYKLDDVGFVGTQGTKSDAEIKRDIEMTIEYIKKRKAEQGSSSATDNSKSSLSGNR